jgi:cytochrome d ubiquinol oxidase subunit II
MPIDYETLRVIWWLLLGVLLTGFALTDGFDLGVGFLLPFIGKNDTERRLIINSIGPTWEGNQVWFVLGGGAIFAAWPTLYGTTFSGFYLAMLVVLLALILRPVAFKYRSKMPDTRWRTSWDVALFIGSTVPAIIFGVAVGNAIEGVPFHFDDNMRVFYTGSFIGLLNPFALIAGLLSLSMLVMHGGNFLAVKLEGELQKRSRQMVFYASIITIILFAIAGILIAFYVQGYLLSSVVLHDGPSNPLYKSVALQRGGWLQNYIDYPWTILSPIFGFLGALLSWRFSKVCSKTAFICSGVSIIGIISTVGFSMFPFILPSSSHPAHGLLVWDSSSSQLTLFIMLIATVIFMPLILLYTAWVYRVLRGKVTEKIFKQKNSQAY